MTTFFELVKREAAPVARSIVIASAASGIANAGILAIINAAARSTDQQALNVRFFLMFVIAMTLYVMCLRFSSREMSRVMIDVVHRIRIRVTGKVQRSELQVMESIGKNRVISAITQESTTIADSGAVIIGGLQAAIVVVFASIYIAFLSIPAFLLTILTSAAGIAIVMQSRAQSRQWMTATKRKEVEFLNYTTDAIDGFKEAKLNARRSADLRADLLRCSTEITSLRLSTETLATRNTILAQSLFYVLIASVVFLLPPLIPTYSTVVVEITTAILFVIGPLRLIIGLIPYFGMCEEATRAIVRLEQALDEGQPAEGDAEPAQKPSLARAFQSLELRNIRFAYQSGGAEHFSIGPVDLRIDAGEILFIIGGNGSGKSTLLKVLTGLYPADSGELVVNGLSAASLETQSYRELFAAVFADFHLFQRLYGLLDVDPASVTALIDEMQLAGKVGVVDHRFNTLELSTGQRKRLALIVSLLDNRPIIVFDELAADQDPEFRRFLYEALFPKLKASGVTVIAATHDDRYFHVADRVIKMEYGMVAHVQV